MQFLKNVGWEMWLSPEIYSKLLGRPEQWDGLRWNDFRRKTKGWYST
jgi:hypothetical protein